MQTARVLLYLMPNDAYGITKLRSYGVATLRTYRRRARDARAQTFSLLRLGMTARSAKLKGWSHADTSWCDHRLAYLDGPAAERRHKCNQSMRHWTVISQFCYGFANACFPSWRISTCDTFFVMVDTSRISRDCEDCQGELGAGARSNLKKILQNSTKWRCKISTIPSCIIVAITFSCPSGCSSTATIHPGVPTRYYTKWEGENAKYES